MPVTAQFETISYYLGFHSEYKTIHARKPKSYAINEQSDYLENSKLATNSRVFQSMFAVNFHNNLTCIKHLIMYEFSLPDF